MGLLAGRPAATELTQRLSSVENLLLDEMSLDILDLLRRPDFHGKVAVMARYPDHVEEFTEAGADVVLQVYERAGAQPADKVVMALPSGAR